MTNLFCLKSKNLHPACLIYDGVCICKENYVGETKRNVENQWEEHSVINKIYEPLDILKSNQTHAFAWNSLMTGLIRDCVRKNLKAAFKAPSRPSLNEQINWKKLPLFRNSIT